MSSNHQHIINLHNYEEWLVLYMDNELAEAEKAAVDAFLLLHPQLQEEFELLRSTKLPATEIVFSGKEELLASAMKLNNVDESLLLYLDNELPAAEKNRVEIQLEADKDFRLQYDLLQKTKLDPADEVAYPDKKELYRYAERRILFPVWMRVAAAVLVLLTGGYLFLNENEVNPAAPADVAVMEKPTEFQTPPVAKRPAAKAPVTPQRDMVATITTKPQTEKKQTKDTPLVPVEEVTAQLASVQPALETAAIEEGDAVHIDLKKLATQQTTALNNSIANLRVTSVVATAYHQTEAPEEPAVTDGDDKQNHRTPAKGFLRKISRFIERRTGIGTVNADNELLVGAVALKLN